MGDLTGTDDLRTTLDSQSYGRGTEIPETSPLLSSSRQRNTCCDKAMLIGLALMLIIGFGIGVYLLCVEGDDDAPEKIIVVARTDWSKQPNILNISNLMLPNNRILIMQTNSKGCSKEFECFQELRRLEKEQMENLDEPTIMYNFIIGGDGRLYEGRGWKYQSAFEDDDEPILTVAFLGNYDDIPPNIQQRKVLKAFIDYAIMRNYLVPCFSVLVGDSMSRHLLDLVYYIEKHEKIENGCLE